MNASRVPARASANAARAEALSRTPIKFASICTPLIEPPSREPCRAVLYPPSKVRRTARIGLRGTGHSWKPLLGQQPAQARRAAHQLDEADSRRERERPDTAAVHEVRIVEEVVGQLEIAGS